MTILINRAHPEDSNHGLNSIYPLRREWLTSSRPKNRGRRPRLAARTRVVRVEMFIRAVTRRQRCNISTTVVSSSSFLRHHFSVASSSSSSSSNAAASLPNIKPNVSLDFKYNNSVAILTINNPRKRNALTVSMMKEMEDHIALLRSWSTGADGGDGTSSVLRNSSKEDDRNDDNYYSTNNDNDNNNKNNARAVILTGSHGTFCSGLDMSASNSSSSSSGSDDEEASSAGDDGEEMLFRMTTITNQLLSLPVLTIAAIDGYAMGGGAELTTATDLVVLSHTANIQFVHAKRGASTGWGGARRLVSKVGRRCAIQLLLLGHCIRGDEEYTRSTIISSSRSGGDVVGGMGGSGMIYADAIANTNENAYDATIRLVIHPLFELPCSYSIRAIKSAISAADGDRDVINITDGTLNNSTNMAVKCEMESFMSVWGSKSNIDQIQITKDRLLKGRRSEEVEESK